MRCEEERDVKVTPSRAGSAHTDSLGHQLSSYALKTEMNIYICSSINHRT